MKLGAALAILIGVSLVVPFLVIAQSPLSGAINLLIIGIGLRQAWRLTAPDEHLIMGLYQVSAGSPPEPA
jgi:hypothetical protein